MSGQAINHPKTMTFCIVWVHYMYVTTCRASVDKWQVESILFNHWHWCHMILGCWSTRIHFKIKCEIKVPVHPSNCCYHNEPFSFTFPHKYRNTNTLYCISSTSSYHAVKTPVTGHPAVSRFTFHIIILCVMMSPKLIATDYVLIWLWISSAMYFKRFSICFL